MHFEKKKKYIGTINTRIKQREEEKGINIFKVTAFFLFRLVV